MELVETLKEIQKKSGDSDQKMAREIGCSRSYYNQICMGNVSVTRSFRVKASQALTRLINRTSAIDRETSETNISLELNIDGSGKYEINTGINMFDHLLSQVTRHGRFDLKITASGDDQHHLAEDVAICLGKALNEALGEKMGIIRMADATVPMDDALATVAVDISGRGYATLELSFDDNDMAGFSTDLIRHFLESLASEAKINLHARILYGVNDHHKAEALFKALGRALDIATRIDERTSGELPSTKNLLE